MSPTTVYDILEKAKLKTAKRLEFQGEGGMTRGARNIFKEVKLLYENMSLYICQDPQNVQHKE